MPSSAGGRKNLTLHVALLLFGLSAIVLVIAVPRFMARHAEMAARNAWAMTVPMEALARAGEPRSANEAALALERAAGSLGFALAPRGSSRGADAPSVGDAETEAFSTLHADLTGLLTGGTASSVSPALASWFARSRASLDALAVDLAGGEPPRWGTADGQGVARSPSPLERCDRLVVEAARLARIPAGESLSGADEHLTRPGTPRWESVVLLDEALLLGALIEGRAGDMQRALRFVTACIRLEEGLMVDADLLSLGVLAFLARLRLAVIRDLAPPIDSGPLLGPDLESRYRDAVVAEAGAFARLVSPDRDEQGSGAVARVADFMFSGPSRAMRASTLQGLQLIAEAAGPTPMSDADLSALSSRLHEAAPAWDSPQRDYLWDIVGIWSRLRRVRAEAEFTKRLLAARMLMLTTGDQGRACREIADVNVASGEPPATVTFTCEADPAGRLALVMRTTAGHGRPAAFEPNLAAPLMPGR